MSKPKILELEEKLEDTGWIDLEFSSNFENYNGTKSNNPKYRKIGNIVMLQGVATPVKTISGSSTEIEMFTLPEEVHPPKEFLCICQGTSMNRWLLTVMTNGRVAFSRYGTSESSSVNSGNWLPFNIVYFID